MNVLYCGLLALIAVMALLSGCQRDTTAPPSQPAASAVAKPAGAVDDTPRALMQEVVARLGTGLIVSDDASYRVMVIPAMMDDSAIRVLPSPRLVLAPDAEHRLLVVEGAVASDTGEPVKAGAAYGGTLGLYGFALQQGRWHLIWDSPLGRGGDTRVLDLGGQRIGLAVNAELCPNGGCDSKLEVFALSAKGARKVLSEPVLTDSLASTGPCADMVKEAANVRAAGESELPAYLQRCFATRGQMSLQARASHEWPDVKIDFTGEVVDIDKKTFEVTRTSNDATLLLRYKGERYEPISGRNPLTPK